jgi:hypothetical protein
VGGFEKAPWEGPGGGVFAVGAGVEELEWVLLMRRGPTMGTLCWGWVDWSVINISSSGRP